MQLSTPETGSAPWKATSTAWLYQPFASAPRAAAAEMLGAVASYWNVSVFGGETLPATSVQVPLTVAVPESGPAYVTLVQDAMPDVASVPAVVTPRAWLYQPFASGARWGVIALAVGGVASRLIVHVERRRSVVPLGRPRSG